MALTAVDKMKITKYLREHAVDDIYYLDLCDALCKRGKIEDIEFLQFFTDSVAKEFRKDEKISMKQLTKMVLIVDNFLHWMHQEGSKIDEKTLDIIRNFEKLYDDYLNRTNFDIDLDFTDNVIGKVNQTLEELYPSETVVNDSSAKYINQIAELEEEIKRLTRELEECSNLHKLVEETNNKNVEKLNSAKQKLTTVRKDLRARDKEIEELKEVIKDLEDKKTKLETMLTEVNEEIEELRDFKEKCEELSTEVLRLKQLIENERAEQEALSHKREIETEMEVLIYQQLLFDGANIEELVKNLSEQGLVTEKNEVYNLLQRIKTKINVTSNTFSLSPNYKIVSPIVSEDGEFKIDVPAGCKHYDIMLVSDFHIKDIDHKVLTGFDILNNYCAGHGINLILNLGDFYHGTAGHTFEYENAVANHRVVEKSISLIPRADGIYHAVLGGNHDRNTVKYGFDPISMLCDGREDFINLGYNHSTIALNGFYNPLGRFDIHHPETFDFPISLTEDGIDFNDLNEYLDGIYTKQGRSREESYVDIFGHTHKSQFNCNAGYCYIPSYFEGKNRRGACHLRIYFDEESEIKYMVFMPLSYNEKLIKTSEIIYQKTLNK